MEFTLTIYVFILRDSKIHPSDICMMHSFRLCAYPPQWQPVTNSRNIFVCKGILGWIFLTIRGICLTNQHCYGLTYLSGGWYLDGQSYSISYDEVVYVNVTDPFLLTVSCPGYLVVLFYTGTMCLGRHLSTRTSRRLFIRVTFPFGFVFQNHAENVGPV